MEKKDWTVNWGQSSGAEIVPFGKYKGQPVEVLLADKGYRDWLMSQDWFRDRFANIYQTVINYGGQPQETPEHNEMQLSFLDDKRCFSLTKLLYPRTPFERDDKWSALSRSQSWVNYGWLLLEEFDKHVEVHWGEPTIVDREFEAKGWDVVFDVSPANVWLEVTSLPNCRCGPCNHEDCGSWQSCQGGNSKCFHEGHEQGPRSIPALEEVKSTRIPEHCAKTCPWSDRDKAKWLLRDSDSFGQKYDHGFEPEWIGTVRVECKPDLSDDFPNVLRQVTKYDRKWNDRCCVVVRRSSFEYVTWEQVEAMFEASGITLLRESRLVDEGRPE